MTRTSDPGGAPANFATILGSWAVKKLLPSSGTLVANMWCTHSPNDMKPVAISESTIASWPNIGRRANVGMIAEMKPSAGRKMKYTSGWPKNQNRCCHRRASPPSAGLKKCVPTIRSNCTRFAASITSGIAKMIISDVTSEAHANSGILRSDMPGLRTAVAEWLEQRFGAVAAAAG